MECLTPDLIRYCGPGVDRGTLVQGLFLSARKPNKKIWSAVASPGVPGAAAALG